MTALSVFLLSGLVLAAVFYFYIRYKNTRKAEHHRKQAEPQIRQLLETVDLDKADKLMIVAHPDDETIWGGAHLYRDRGRYLVVCVTAGTDAERDEELHKAMTICEAQYLKLGFPDLNAQQQQDRWKNIEDDISATLALIMSAKKWEWIVTHNPRGEYGHRHHRKISRFVTSGFKKLIHKDKLFYFGIYYKRRYPEKLKRHTPLPPDLASVKLERMLPAYASQIGQRKSHEHMFLYEDWIPYNKWNGFITLLRSRNILP